MKEEIVKEWFERAKRDFDTAGLVFAHKGHYNEVVFLVHQAVEKYLKGYLIYQGWKLRKTHNVETLLTEAARYDQSFNEFLTLGRKLTLFYYEDRYPPGPGSEVLEKEAEEIMSKAQKMIKKIKKETRFKDDN